MDRQRVAAVAAQFSQAGTSLLLSMVAVRALPGQEFGQYVLIMSAIVLATAATTGLVGDSLTVLDRSDPSMRRTLQAGAAVSSLVSAAAILVLSGVLGWSDWSTAAVAAIAAGAFVLEDLARRLLMANRRFDAVIITDVAYALGAAAVLALAVAADSLGLRTFFVAIALGQAVALVVARMLVPRSDRHLATLRGRRAVRELLRFGGWRALHVTVGPLKMWITRLVVSAAAGFAAVGALEANRLLVAPLMLVIQGMSSALLVGQVALLRSAPERSFRQADRDAAVLLAAIGAALAAALLLREPLAGVLLGSTDLLDVRLLAGWGLVALAMAANVPYSNLTAAAGQARAALAMRLLDLGLGVLGMAVIALLLSDQTWYVWVPATLGVLGCVVAPLQRRVARRSARLATAGQGGHLGNGAGARE